LEEKDDRVMSDSTTALTCLTYIGYGFIACRLFLEYRKNTQNYMQQKIAERRKKSDAYVADFIVMHTRKEATGAPQPPPSASLT